MENSIRQFFLPELTDPITRREALKRLMAASTALALGVTGCERKPRRQIVSRPHRPEFQPPADSVFYASAWTEGEFPYGLTIETVGGRPVKIEGNPDDPIGQGASTAAMQASILSLYDPDRLRAPLRDNAEVTWDEVDQSIAQALGEAGRVVLMTRANLGPSERTLVERFLRVCPAARHFVHESIHDAPRRRAWRRFYGVEGEPVPRFDRARVILSLDADFLGAEGATVEQIRFFAKGRALDGQDGAGAEMSRLYVVESAMTVTGSNADERIPLRPSAMGRLALALREAVAGNRAALDSLAQGLGLDRELLAALAEDLRTHRGESLVVAGGHLPGRVHSAVAALNADLMSADNTLQWNPQPAALPVSEPREIEAAFQEGVDVAILLGVNPVYDWPGGEFAALLNKARLTAGHGLYRDETLAACSLALPSAHGLESWNDARARQGVEYIVQPVIAPLFGGRQEAESLLNWTQALADAGDPIHEHADWHGYLKDRWRAGPDTKPTGGAAQEMTGQEAWNDLLRKGGRFEEVMADPMPAPVDLEALNAELRSSDLAPGSSYEAVLLPHHALHDGRFANNAWLQELPDPVSKLVWDNAAAIAPRTAQALGVAEGDLIALSAGGRTVEIPALVQPGVAENVVVLTLGHGRTAGGEIAEMAGGVNVAPLSGASDPATPRLLTDIAVRKAVGNVQLVRTQKQFSMAGRPIVLGGLLAQYRRKPDFIQRLRHRPDPAADLYRPYDYSIGHKWTMAIDLGACVGCGACVAACQAENNIPVVGKEQCANGREMHWLRIDRYEEGDDANPTIHNQPMLCQHCDNAPCENVCPVNATTHSPEGINEMTYNRCVGTRYCSNNCPYKVRRFNFLRYHEARLRDPVQELVYNPQVTVRGVGVMEKCTFCIQRINEAKFHALNQNNDLADGSVQTACQQACPARAIVFGNANDPDSTIARARASTRAFYVLEEMNIKPNVAYLARIRNPAREEG